MPVMERRPPRLAADLSPLDRLGCALPALSGAGRVRADALALVAGRDPRVPERAVPRPDEDRLAERDSISAAGRPPASSRATSGASTTSSSCRRSIPPTSRRIRRRTRRSASSTATSPGIMQTTPMKVQTSGGTTGKPRPTLYAPHRMGTERADPRARPLHRRRAPGRPSADSAHAARSAMPAGAATRPATIISARCRSPPAPAR